MKDKECKTIKDNVNSIYEEQWSSYSEDDVLLRMQNLSIVIDAIISQVELRENSKILDLGTGPAVIPLRLVQTQNIDLDIYGLDLSRDAVHLGQRVLGKNVHYNVQLLLGDWENLPFFEGTIDAVFSNATFNLLLNKERGFLEMARVTKSGGMVVVGDCITKERRCKSQEEQNNQLWSQCVAGAPTKEEILDQAQKVGLKNIGIFNLTQKVKELVGSGLWNWLEFNTHDLTYYIFSFKKEP